MATITVYSPNHKNTISIYSSVRPWQYVRDHEIRYISNRPGPDDSDILFMERPQWNEDIKMLLLWKAAGKKVWVDHDDNVYRLPEFNSLKDFYDSCADNIKIALTHADVVTTCSESTAREWRGICGKSEKVKVLPVRYSPDIYKIPDLHGINERSQNKIIAWRGSNTHRGDLESVQNDLIKFFQDNRDWKMVFFGSGQNWLAEKIKGACVIETLGFDEYMQKLKDIAPSVMFIPWVPNIFNAGKSEIAFYEATAVGAAFVCARWGQYAKLPAVHYDGKISAYDALSMAVNNTAQSDALWLIAKDKMLYGEYHMRNATAIRESIIRGLLS